MEIVLNVGVFHCLNNRKRIPNTALVNDLDEFVHLCIVRFRLKLKRQALNGFLREFQFS